MPRLRNIATGVIVNVSDSTAANLSGYEPVEDAKPSSSTKKTERSTK